MIGERLKELRKMLGLTQIDFGNRIGVTRDVISNIEIGRVEMNGLTLIAICKTFGASEKWLRDGIGEMFEPGAEDESVAAFVGSILSDDNDPFQKRFISMLSKLSPEDWHTIEKMVDLMVVENKKAGD